MLITITEKHHKLDLTEGAVWIPYTRSLIQEWKNYSLSQTEWKILLSKAPTFKSNLLTCTNGVGFVVPSIKQDPETSFLLFLTLKFVGRQQVTE